MKYLCAILNSTLVTWFIKNTAVTTGMGLTQWDKFVVNKVPIPMIAVPHQRSFVDLIDKILSAKADNPSADIHAAEEEIDRLAYSLYKLSSQEIAKVASI